MKTLIYAGDYKYFTCLLPIAKELKERNHPYFFLFNLDTQVKFPSIPQHREFFSYRTQLLYRKFRIKSSFYS